MNEKSNEGSDDINLVDCTISLEFQYLNGRKEKGEGKSVFTPSRLSMQSSEI